MADQKEKTMIEPILAHIAGAHVHAEDITIIIVAAVVAIAWGRVLRKGSR